MKKLFLVFLVLLTLTACSVNQVKLALTAAQAAISASEQLGVISDPAIASYFDIASECVTVVSSELGSTDSPAQQALKSGAGCLPFLQAKLPLADSKIVGLAQVILVSVQSILSSFPKTQQTLLAVEQPKSVKVVSANDKIKIGKVMDSLAAAHAKLHKIAHSGK